MLSQGAIFSNYWSLYIFVILGCSKSFVLRNAPSPVRSPRGSISENFDEDGGDTSSSSDGPAVSLANKFFRAVTEGLQLLFDVLVHS